MKGVIQAYALLVLCLGVSLGMMIAVQYDVLFYKHQFILKQSMQESMLESLDVPYQERDNFTFNRLVELLKMRMDPFRKAEVSLMGFNAQPLAFRVRLDVFALESIHPYTIHLEKTMIEVSP
jgi:hypothetical protein